MSNSKTLIDTFLPAGVPRRSAARDDCVEVAVSKRDIHGCALDDPRNCAAARAFNRAGYDAWILYTSMWLGEYDDAGELIGLVQYNSTPTTREWLKNIDATEEGVPTILRFHGPRASETIEGKRERAKQRKSHESKGIVANPSHPAVTLARGNKMNNGRFGRVKKVAA